jgi:hypothetical protein
MIPERNPHLLGSKPPEGSLYLHLSPSGASVQPTGRPLRLHATSSTQSGIFAHAVGAQVPQPIFGFSASCLQCPGCAVSSASHASVQRRQTTSPWLFVMPSKGKASRSVVTGSCPGASTGARHLAPVLTRTYDFSIATKPNVVTR